VVREPCGQISKELLLFTAREVRRTAVTTGKWTVVLFTSQAACSWYALLSGSPPKRTGFGFERAAE